MFFRSPVTSLGLRKTVTYVLVTVVTHVLANFCYLCPGHGDRCDARAESKRHRAELIRLQQKQVIDPDEIVY